MNSTWKLVVRSFKSHPPPQARARIEQTILEEGGVPLKLREARRRLFILTTRATGGKPVIIEGEDGLACLIALDDLVEIVMDPPPTLAEVMRRTR
ncbi:hypothetical protein QTL95_18245 [Rhizobium sp. S152]|uniref:hypothetical protein n=1 Tax=Rhizobium sp. S152 TaxID=3055038 RepID=UPI0025A9B5A2|nr:hypothetical protein [Rhizobium sp. S152]MDM9627835.1 hypothetical protein [Rhizobium sp. S152]